MGYYDEFPRTNFYQQDLGWLIKEYHRLNKSYEYLVKIYDIIKEDVKNITLEILQEWLDSGQLLVELKYIQETKTLNMTFAKVGEENE